MYETIFNTCKTLDELKKAYKAAAMQHHPDVGGSTAATQEVSRSADLLAQLADTPNDIAVKHGLQALKTSTLRRDTAAGLLARLEQYE